MGLRQFDVELDPAEPTFDRQDIEWSVLGHPPLAPGFNPAHTTPEDFDRFEEFVYATVEPYVSFLAQPRPSTPDVIRQNGRVAARLRYFISGVLPDAELFLTLAREAAADPNYADPRHKARYIDPSIHKPSAEQIKARMAAGSMRQQRLVDKLEQYAKALDGDIVWLQSEAKWFHGEARHTGKENW